jgi:hypothetical protein
MATFNFFSDILPDPINKITDQGDIDPTGVAGPGFSAINFISNGETQVSRTNSGRGVHRDQEVQYWSFSIKYHPMFRFQFDPVDAFLASRNARRDPFFVVLPQYSKPKNAIFASFAETNTIRNKGGYESGITSMMLDCGGNFPAYASPGDMFTITDTSNTNHLKAYKVTRVETNARYQASTTQPELNEMRIHFSPPLTRNLADNSVINFIKPKFRVIARSDLREYSLDTNNLYQFSLDLEEIMP